MKNNYFTILLLSMLFLGSCVSNKVIIPPYTNVEKIIKVKAGMSIEEVNATLGISPYDIYTIQEDGTSVLLYNYRIKERKMKIPHSIESADNLMHTDERGQTDGETYYINPSKIYIMFLNGKMKSVLTDKGKEEASFLMLTNNGIQLISKEQLTVLQKTPKTQYYMLNDKGELKPLNINTSDNCESKTILVPTQLHQPEKKEFNFLKSSTTPKKPMIKAPFQ